MPENRMFRIEINFTALRSNLSREERRELSEHEVQRWLRLMERLGIAPRGTHLEFPLREHDWRAWRSLHLQNYAVIHPGSQLPSRRSRRRAAARYRGVAGTTARGRS